MRFRTELFALLVSSAACSGQVDRTTAVTSPPPTPVEVQPASRAQPVTRPLVLGTKVTPVSTLFVAADAQPKGRPLAEVAAPWSLTASDGSGLLLARVDARAVVEGPLAFTELHLYFHNPEARIREGTFAITLPTGAAVSRFAMETDGQLVEAEVVEKQLARRAYDDFLHRKQDPALLEKGEGNQFTAKIFPIPANADKHVVLSFSQEVSPGHYTLPLRGLAKSERVDVRVQVRAQDGNILEQTFAQRSWVPDRDVVVDAASLVAPAAIVAGELAAARVTVAMQGATEAPTGVTLLVDTSASRALGFEAYAGHVEELVGELARAYGTALPVQVVAFDQITRSIYDGTAGNANGTVANALVKRGALGASDLGQALVWLGMNAPKARVVMIGDGVVTAGANADGLAAAAKLLADRGVERIDVALAGGIRDDHAARAVARSGLAHAGAVLDLDRDPHEVARRLGLAVRTDLAITVADAPWIFPRTLDAAQAGDEITVFARRPIGPLDAPGQVRDLAITIGGATTTLAPIAVTPALVSRALASAEIGELDGKLASLTGDAATRAKAEIVAKSLANRVVSSQTSMLVLESTSDYARFGIDRTALADILSIGPGGVELLHRATPAQIAVSTTKPRTPATDGKPSEPAKPAELAANKMPEAPAPEKVATKDLPASSQAIEDKTVSQEKRKEEAQEPDLKVAVASQGSAPGAPPPQAEPMATGVASGPRTESRRPDRDHDDVMDSQDARDDEDRGGPALHGPLAEVEAMIRGGRVDAALAKAQKWHLAQPGDVLALIGYGDALEAKKDLETAGRVYGSIIDLFPNRADFRRFAGERLERVGATQRKLVIDTYRRAVGDRPDHLTGHRLLAYALVRDGQYDEAFAAILTGIDHRYPDNRFAGGERVLAEDAGMIAAAVIAHDKGRRADVLAQLAKRDLSLATQASTRFIMYWETDANDVDFHIRDASGGHAWYSNMQLRSGGELYADITTGYGPECFAIQGKPTAGPYRLSINYYSQGPMGYGMGLLQIQKFDGRGNLTFEDRPYVIMNDHAFVDLGSYR
ncbi:MAG: VIT domain-containing protein [Proteobacteria bacterium]|nr:VIT domain-containing protein [Pseudomonadota bacterium]